MSDILSRVKETVIERTYKHLPGAHNQKLHGNRGGVSARVSESKIDYSKSPVIDPKASNPSMRIDSVPKFPSGSGLKLFTKIKVGDKFHVGVSNIKNGNISWEVYQKTSPSRAVVIQQNGYGNLRRLGVEKRFSPNNTVFYISDESQKAYSYKHLHGEHPQKRHGYRGTSSAGVSETSPGYARSAPRTPYVIQTMINQMGGRGINGAFAYVGATNLMYEQKTKEGYPNETRYHPENGTFDTDTGLVFNVNMGKGAQWKMIVAYQPNDTYSVFLWRGFRMEKASKTGKMGEAVTKIHDVYADELQGTVESVYDNAIKQYKGGFTPIY